MPVRLEHGLPVVRPTMERRFGLMAEGLLVRTNDDRLLAAAEASFGRFAVPPDDGRPLVVELYVDPGIDALPAPSVRRVRHRLHGDLYLVDGSGGERAIAVVDEGRAVAFVTEATLADPTTLRYDYVEAMALALLSRSRGYLTIHAAGIVLDGIGVVLHGPAGAGKSTLAMACARRGFGILAEDAVFARRRTADGVEVWGLPWLQRLLPDARERFPELAALEPRLQPNGEAKIEVDLDVVHPGRATPCALAGPIVHIARDTGGPTRIEALAATDDDATLPVHWPWDGGWTLEHDRCAELLSAGGVYRLHMNGPVDEAVDALVTMRDGRSVPA
jgi:hypothetical protein